MHHELDNLRVDPIFSSTLGIFSFHVSVYLSLFYLSSGFMYTASAAPDGQSFRISFSTTQHTRQRRKEVHGTVLAALSTGIAALKTLDNLGEVGGEEEKKPPSCLRQMQSLIGRRKRKNITHRVRLVLKDNSRPQRPSLSERPTKKYRDLY